MARNHIKDVYGQEFEILAPQFKSSKTLTLGIFLGRIESPLSMAKTLWTNVPISPKPLEIILQIN